MSRRTSSGRDGMVKDMLKGGRADGGRREEGRREEQVRRRTRRRKMTLAPSRELKIEVRGVEVFE